MSETEKTKPELSEETLDELERCHRESHSELSAAGCSVKMPKELTAENGAKHLMIGEFKEAFTMQCHECDGKGDIDGEPCEECDSCGNYVVHVPIHWTTIKEIYAKAVEHLSIT